jgi:hypothetical protein
MGKSQYWREEATNLDLISIVSKICSLILEMSWHLTSKLSQATSTAAHSSSIYMTFCLLDQLGRTVWKGLASFFLLYGRQDTKSLGKRPRFSKKPSNTLVFTCHRDSAGLAPRENKLSVPSGPQDLPASQGVSGSLRFH